MRVAKHFDAPSKTGPILTSLLYRHGRDDFIDYESLRPSSSKEEDATNTNTSSSSDNDKVSLHSLSSEQARDLSKSYQELKSSMWTRYESSSEEHESYHFNNRNAAKQPPHLILYKSLLREVIGGSNVHMMFAIQAKERRKDFFSLTNIIQREFRKDVSSKSYIGGYSDSCRIHTAFLAFKELNKKLTWAETMGKRKLSKDDNNTPSWMESESVPVSNKKEDIDDVVLSDVSVLPTQPASSYLQPGCFLVAHPLLTGIFHQSVICILDHTAVDESDHNNDNNNNDDDMESNIQNGGTYGLIVNQPLMMEESSNNNVHRNQRRRTLNEIIRNDCLPEGVKLAFGDSPVRSGGPVNMSVQMLRIAEPIQESKLQIGGNVLPMIQNDSNIDDHDDCSSTAVNGDSAIYFGGDIIKASQAIIDSEMNKESFSFVVGASCWEEGQLESEVERGYWIPCKAPPHIAFNGRLSSFLHDGDEEKDGSDLWVSMMSAVSEEDGILAKMIRDADFDENSYPCDDLKV